MNDTIEKLLAQARELQQTAQEAATKTAEQMQPILKKSIEDAQTLQTTLSKHATETSTLASAQTQKAIDYLSEFMKIGLEATRQTAEQAQATAAKLAEHSRDVAESVQAAINKKPKAS
jgi:hypothetical protein